jgi:4-amino-4-deoxy-L-arabinose transferase-like glycosyltransferase
MGNPPHVRRIRKGRARQVRRAGTYIFDVGLSEVIAARRAWISPLTIRARWIVPLLVVAVAWLIIFFRLGSASLASWDESIYAQVAKEMLETGDWMTTRYDHRFFFDKPPLLMWAQAFLFQSFGMTELNARVPSALAGVGILLLTYLLGARAYGSLAGVVGVAILLSTSGFLQYARFGTTDSLLAFFSYLAIYAYLRARAGTQRWWLLLGAALGLAVMTKSAAAGLPTATIGLAFLLDPEARRRARLEALAGAAAVMIVIVAPWHVFMFSTYGKDFFDGYVGEQILARTTGGLRNNNQDALFYIRAVLPFDFFPWVFMLPLGLLFAVTDRTTASISRMLAVLVVAALAFYASVNTKFPWYMFPIYPASAILIAGFLTRGLVSGRLTAALAGIAALAAGTYVLVTHGFPGVFTARAKIMVGGIALSAAVAVIFWLRRRDLPLRHLALVMAAFFFVVGASILPPLFTKTEDAVAILSRSAARTDPDSALIFVFFKDDIRPEVTYYSDKKVIVAEDARQMASLLPLNSPAPAIFAKANLQEVSTTCAIEPVADSGEYVYVRLTRRGP